MPKYRVKLTKHEIYSNIEANSIEEAEEIALDYYQNDKMAFLDDWVDEIEVERIDNKMAKWKIAARPDEEDYECGLRPKEKIIEANDYEGAIRAAWREYPEYHQVSAYEIKE